MKIKLYINTGFAACEYKDEIEIEDDFWDEMDEAEREKFLNEEAFQFLYDHIDFGAYPKIGE